MGSTSKIRQTQLVVIEDRLTVAIVQNDPKWVSVHLYVDNKGTILLQDGARCFFNKKTTKAERLRQVIENLENGWADDLLKVARELHKDDSLRHYLQFTQA